VKLMSNPRTAPKFSVRGCNRTLAAGVPRDEMDTSSNEETPTQGSTEASTTPLRLAFDGEAKKHFDTFETHFFQQGDEAELSGAYDIYEEPDMRIKRWLPYRVLLGISAVSTAVAVIACIALWRNKAPAPVGSIVVAPQQTAPPLVVPPAPSSATVIAASVPTSAPPAPPAPPAPAAVGPVAEEIPVPAAQAAPVVVLPSALPSAPPVAAQPAAVKAEEPAAPTLAKVEEPTADADKAKAEAPVAAAPAPVAENDVRSRCRQSIRARRARDIVTVCSAAFEQDSADVDAAVAVAKVEFDRGRTAQAYTWSKKVIAVNPATADAYVFAGSVEQSQGHGKAAKEDYQHYLRLAPSGRYAAEIRSIVNSL